MKYELENLSEQIGDGETSKNTEDEFDSELTMKSRKLYDIISEYNKFKDSITEEDKDLRDSNLRELSLQAIILKPLLESLNKRILDLYEVSKYYLNSFEDVENFTKENSILLNEIRADRLHSVVNDFKLRMNNIEKELKELRENQKLYFDLMEISKKLSEKGINYLLKLIEPIYNLYIDIMKYSEDKEIWGNFNKIIDLKNSWFILRSGKYVVNDSIKVSNDSYYSVILHSVDIRGLTHDFNDNWTIENNIEIVKDWENRVEFVANGHYLKGIEKLIVLSIILEKLRNGGDFKVYLGDITAKYFSKDNIDYLKSVEFNCQLGELLRKYFDFNAPAENTQKYIDALDSADIEDIRNYVLNISAIQYLMTKEKNYKKKNWYMDFINNSIRGLKEKGIIFITEEERDEQRIAKYYHTIRFTPNAIKNMKDTIFKYLDFRKILFPLSNHYSLGDLYEMYEEKLLEKYEASIGKDLIHGTKTKKQKKQKEEIDIEPLDFIKIMTPSQQWIIRYKEYVAIFYHILNSETILAEGYAIANGYVLGAKYINNKLINSLEKRESIHLLTYLSILFCHFELLEIKPYNELKIEDPFVSGIPLGNMIYDGVSKSFYPTEDAKINKLPIRSYLLIDYLIKANFQIQLYPYIEKKIPKTKNISELLNAKIRLVLYDLYRLGLIYFYKAPFESDYNVDKIFIALTYNTILGLFGRGAYQSDWTKITDFEKNYYVRIRKSKNLSYEKLNEVSEEEYQEDINQFLEEKEKHEKLHRKNLLTEEMALEILGLAHLKDTKYIRRIITSNVFETLGEAENSVYFRVREG